MKIKQVLRYISHFLPDKWFICLDYFRFFGKFPDLKNPKTFNEKLQWLKLYNRKTEHTQMVDKYHVREYVAKRIGEEYLIPLLGVWDRPEEIDFSVLPRQFVLKCTHDSGSLVICRNKDKFDEVAARESLKKCLRRNYYRSNREWPYKNVRPRIIAEKYMEDETDLSGLRDYKFFCFNNEPRFVYLSEGSENHETAITSAYDFNGEQMPFTRRDYKPMPGAISFPNTIEKMKNIAAEIAKDANAPFVRVDLYSIHGQIYFSEITFFPRSGFMPFEPREWDRILGEWIQLPLGEAVS